MIELPEAFTIARQMTAELRGRRIQSGNRGNSPHKFAFYSRSSEEYEAILPGKRVGESVAHGTNILTPLDPGCFLVLGGGGERILFHEDEKSLPKKYQLLLRFEDGAHLSVSIQGWGSAMLLESPDLKVHPHLRAKGPSPLSDEFTYDYFRGLFEGLPPGDPRAIKYFLISEPGVWGLGNGYTQDILFRAGIHPRRRAVDVSEDGRRSLYRAVREVLAEATELGGRDSEKDLYGRPGGYKRVLDSKAVGKPCPLCGTTIEKIQFLGGASYFCPGCQR